MSRRTAGLLTFLLLTFGITWFVEIGLLRRIEYGTMPYQLGVMGIMFVPAISAVIVRVFVEREGFADAGLRWGFGRYYIWAWLIPIVIAAGAMGLSVAFRQAEFDPWMTEWMLRVHMQAPNLRLPPFHLLRIFVIVSALTQAVIMNCIPCFGEEFGWRGYMLMRLMPLGTNRALLASGLIWGLWHAPIILQGHNYPNHPRLGVLLMVGFCVCLGYIFGWLRLASGSVLPATVAHASVNGPGSTPLMFLRARSDITTGLTGLIGQALMAVFVIVIWRLGAYRKENLRDRRESDARREVPEPAE